MGFTLIEAAAIYDELRRRVRALPGGRWGSVAGTAAVNEALVRIFGCEMPKTFKTKGDFLNYFYAVVRHVRLDHDPNKKANRLDALIHLGPVLRGDFVFDPSEIAALELMLDQLRADNFLAEGDRIAKVVELHLIGGLTLAETASELGIKEPTAKLDKDYFRSWVSSRLLRERRDVETAIQRLEQEGTDHSVALAARLALLECRPINLVARQMKLTAAAVQELLARFEKYVEGPR